MFAMKSPSQSRALTLELGRVNPTDKQLSVSDGVRCEEHAEQSYTWF